MCRLYGFIGNEPIQNECSLVRSQNALLAQRRLDSRGLSNHDGWGIAYYTNSHPKLQRRATAAYEDTRFDVAAASVYSRVVVAHVRKSTEGAASEANTYPYSVGRWVFAHNGTIPSFARLRPRMEAEIGPELLQLRRGTTDSELAFLWLLNLIRQGTPDASDSGAPLETTVDSVSQVIRRIDGWCHEMGAERDPTLNFVLTDGRTLVASRQGNSLCWLSRSTFQRCEECERCHCPHCADVPDARHAAKEGYRTVVVASEPITKESWIEVPEGHVLAIDNRMGAEILDVI